MQAKQKNTKRVKQVARWVLAFSLCLAHVPGQTAFGAETLRYEGSSSRESREQALRGIPLSTLTAQAIAKLRPVLDDPTIFRKMPTQSIVCDTEMFNFIVRYPEVLVEIWELMGMTRVNIQRTGPFSFSGQDGAGTTCRSEMILGSDRLHIYYSEGDYEGGLISRKLDGRCVCVIHSQPAVGEAGQALVTASMDIFLKLDNVGADLIAKTISPLVVKTADSNYIESLRFVSQLSTAAQRNPQAIEQLADRLTGLRPDVRKRFVQVAQQSSSRRDRLVAARARQQGDPPSEPSLVIGKAMPNTIAPPEPRTILPAYEDVPSDAARQPTSESVVR